MSYYKMYTRMHWWPQFLAHKERGMLDPSNIHELFLIYPPEDRGISQPHFPIKHAFDYTIAVRDLLNRRPELRETIGKVDGRIHQFVRRLQFWVNKGYIYKVAFDKTEKEMAENLQEVKVYSAMQSAIGSSSNIRSFYDFYQATAEYEGNVKVKRLQENLPKYKRSIEGVSIFSDIPYVNEWEHLNADLVNSTTPDDYDPISFQEKASQLVKIHHEKVNNFDGLSGLSEHLSTWIFDSKRSDLEKQKNDIVESLVKLGVTLGPDNQLDLSAVKNQALIDSLKNNEMIRLMFVNDYKDPIVKLDHIEETVGELPPEGDLLPPPIHYPTINPYYQIYGRLPTEYYEPHEDRIERLKRIWNSNKIKTQEEQLDLQQAAVEAMRKVRMRLDQCLVNHGKTAVFPLNQKLSQSDLMLTYKFDIDKMNMFLDNIFDLKFDQEHEKMEDAEITKLLIRKKIDEEIEPYTLYEGKRSDLVGLNDITEENYIDDPTLDYDPIDSEHKMESEMDGKERSNDKELADEKNDEKDDEEDDEFRDYGEDDRNYDYTVDGDIDEDEMDIHEYEDDFIDENERGIDEHDALTLSRLKSSKKSERAPVVKTPKYFENNEIIDMTDSDEIEDPHVRFFSQDTQKKKSFKPKMKNDNLMRDRFGFNGRPNTMFEFEPTIEQQKYMRPHLLKGLKSNENMENFQVREDDDDDNNSNRNFTKKERYYMMKDRRKNRPKRS